MTIVARSNMMQYKHRIYLQKFFDLSKIGCCWYQRSIITQMKNVSSYSNPKILKPEIVMFDKDNNLDSFNMNNNDGNIFNNTSVTYNNDDSVLNEPYKVYISSKTHISYSSFNARCNN